MPADLKLRIMDTASSDKITSRLRRMAGAGAAAAALVLAAVLFVCVTSSDTQYETAVETGVEYASLQQYSLAIEAFETALEIKEDDLETRILLLESCAGAGDYDGLAEKLEESIVIVSMEEYAQLEAAAVELYEEGAEVSAAAGDVDTAVELYERVLALADEESDAAENANAQLSDLYLTQAFETSIARFEMVLEKDPDNIEALTMTAQLYDSLGEYEEAIEYYGRLAEASGDSSDIAQDIARCWSSIAAQRTGDAAIAAWEEVLSWDEESEEAYLALAQLYLDAKDAQSAMILLNEGLEFVGSEEMQALYDELYEELYVSEFEQLVIDIIEGITTEDMTAEEKRLACYQYIIDTTSYVRTYEQPSGDWTKDYALDVLALQQGNCFRYAAAFAYMCLELGYDAKVCTGEVSAAAGGTTPHGWVVLTIDGVEYLCDPDLEQSLGYDFYMKTYSEYPVKPLITEEEWEISF